MNDFFIEKQADYFVRMGGTAFFHMSFHRYIDFMWNTHERLVDITMREIKR